QLLLDQVVQDLFPQDRLVRRRLRPVRRRLDPFLELRIGDQPVIDPRHDLLDELAGKGVQGKADQGDSGEKRESFHLKPLTRRLYRNSPKRGRPRPGPRRLRAASFLANASSHAASSGRTASPAGEGTVSTRAGEIRAPRVLRTKSIRRS